MKRRLFSAAAIAQFRILIALVAFVFCAAGLSQTMTSPSFLNKLEPLQQAQFVSTPDDDHSSLLDAFATAKKSIKVGIFGISGQHIADGLIAAQKRGVLVTIICDVYCVSNDKRAAIVSQLKAAGVSVVSATPGFTISHWKMFVIDDKKAFISTMNFISRFNQMRDLGVFVTNPSIVHEILTVFSADLENAKQQTAMTPPLRQPNLVWSPVNAEDKLVHLINSASKSIEIWIENMGNPAVHLALKKAVERQVIVRLMTSLCGIGTDPAFTFARLHELLSLGVTVQVMPYPATSEIPYIHAKVIVVDKSTTFLGSENFSTNSLLKARELGIIFRDMNLQNRLNAYFEADWKQTIAVPKTPPEKCKALQP